MIKSHTTPAQIKISPDGMRRDVNRSSRVNLVKTGVYKYKVPLHWFWVSQLLRSQPKPNAQICSITSLLSESCSQQNCNDAISAKRNVFSSSFPLTTEPEIKTGLDQWRHTTGGQANTCTFIRGWWVGGGFTATGWAYPEDLFCLTRWREGSGIGPLLSRWAPGTGRTLSALPTTERISMDTKMSPSTTNSTSFSDWLVSVAREMPACHLHLTKVGVREHRSENVGNVCWSNCRQSHK